MSKYPTSLLRTWCSHAIRNYLPVDKSNKVNPKHRPFFSMTSFMHRCTERAVGYQRLSSQPGKWGEKRTCFCAWKTMCACIPGTTIGQIIVVLPLGLILVSRIGNLTLWYNGPHTITVPIAGLRPVSSYGCQWLRWNVPKTFWFIAWLTASYASRQQSFRFFWLWTWSYRITDRVESTGPLVFDYRPHSWWIRMHAT